LEGTKILLFK